MKKIALVTGSSRGIGLAAAKELENGGCQVVYHASRVSDKLLAAAGTSPFYGVDLSDAEAVGAFADELISKTMVPDILVLNASYQSYTGIGNFSESEYRKMFDTNILSTGILLSKLLPEMQKKQWGRVIFVSSVNGVKPAGRLAVYGSTKAAFQNIARTAAQECAQFNITVNSILPGVIETDRNAEALSDKAFSDMLKEKVPMHRFGTAEECGKLIAFLASDAAGYITGAEIPIAGGLQF
ncbi:MAG: SDR family oxidoreductase [Lentisphaerae bacterium]|nr:SDR family oxidoreductase [Lentisphaerota bacterium]